MNLCRFCFSIGVLVLPFTTILAMPSSTTQPILPPGYLLCPPLSALHKNAKTLVWSTAHSDWRSFSTSFADHLSEFLGAQWQGVNVGSVACLYRSPDKITFPVVLQFNRLVYEPKGGQWGKNLGGYVNCFSHHRHDCIFKPQPNEKVGDIYQTINKLKGSSQQELGF